MEGGRVDVLDRHLNLLAVDSLRDATTSIAVMRRLTRLNRARN